MKRILFGVFLLHAFNVFSSNIIEFPGLNEKEKRLIFEGESIEPKIINKENLDKTMIISHDEFTLEVPKGWDLRMSAYSDLADATVKSRPHGSKPLSAPVYFNFLAKPTWRSQKKDALQKFYDGNNKKMQTVTWGKRNWIFVKEQGRSNTMMWRAHAFENGREYLILAGADADEKNVKLIESLMQKIKIVKVEEEEYRPETPDYEKNKDKSDNNQKGSLNEKAGENLKTEKGPPKKK